MKRLLAVAALLAIAASVQARQQVLTNGSFEDRDPNDPNILALDPNGDPFWQTFGDIVVTTADAFEGDSSYAMLGLPGWAGGYLGPRAETSVGPGVNIRMRCMAKHESAMPISGDACPQSLAGIKLETFPPIGFVTPPPIEDLVFPKNDPNDPNDDDPDDVWVQKTLVAVVPADITLARVVLINFDNSTTNGPVYMDDVRAELASDPGVNQLINASFESGTDAEDGIDNWNEFASAASGARFNLFEIPAQDGFAVVKFTGETAGLTQEFAVTPGDTITLTGWFRSDSGNPYLDVDAQVGLKIEWDFDLNIPGVVDICPNSQPQSALNNLILNTTPTDVWVPLTIDDYLIPADGGAGIRATVLLAWPDGGANVYFDAFEMVLTNVFDGSDLDFDDDADMSELAALQTVVTGNGGGMLYPGLVFDHDDDDDVDEADAIYTIDRITGPN
jgi:hypothetical protein